jgi:hypothetical protein
MRHGTRPVERQILRLLRVADFLVLVERRAVGEEPTSQG